MAMARHKVIRVLLIASFLTLSSLEAAAQGKKPTPPPVRRIDHIMIRADDPGKLYVLFTEILKLPVAWPLETRGGVTSGGVGFGNVNVEAIQFPGQKSSHPTLVGFGFEPSPLAECLRELDRRGITYGDLRPFILTEQDGTKKTRFTNVTLLQFSDADRPANATMHVFLSEYSPTYVNVEQRRVRLGRELLNTGGGPLGILGVKEVTVGATDLKAAIKLWGTLLAPRRSLAKGLWSVGDGPTIRVVRTGENRLHGLVVSVSSLRRARVFLQQKGLLGSVSKKGLTLDGSGIEGLNILLVGGR